jgi:Fe-S-cluster containining protein
MRAYFVIYAPVPREKFLAPQWGRCFPVYMSTANETEALECRRCGACCIAPSISSAITALGGGKAAGLRCPHLDEENLCSIYGRSDRPLVCSAFSPSELCGKSPAEAMRNLELLEELTR